MSTLQFVTFVFPNFPPKFQQFIRNSDLGGYLPRFVTPNLLAQVGYTECLQPVLTRITVMNDVHHCM